MKISAFKEAFYMQETLRTAKVCSDIDLNDLRIRNEKCALSEPLLLESRLSEFMNGTAL